MADQATISLFNDTLVLLGAAVIAVPITKKIGLGSILGYFAAGIIIGPIAQIITDADAILHVAELGVVLLLFVVGLELKPSRLWAMRRDIFGLGFLQVILTGILLTAIIAQLRSMNEALIIGFGLALSSTAFSLQIMDERNELNTGYGQKAFAILLFQDLSIIPLIAMVAFLMPGVDNGNSGIDLLKMFGAIITLILAGRYLLNPLFRLLASANAREIMTAASLLLVLGVASLMQFVGLSMALGAFIAGVMLAESSFRHELEADIEPFRGLLMGLFFIAIGMTVNIAHIMENWWIILILTPLLMIVKAFILYGLTRMFGSNHMDSIRVALLLPQNGEFAFVLLAAGTSLLTQSDMSIVTAIVTLSMALTPLSVALQRFMIRETHEVLTEDFEGANGSILIIGFGRFGQITSQMLIAEEIPVTIIDNSADRIRAAARFGTRIYYGDGARLDVLRAAGAEHARIIAICTHKACATKIVDLVRPSFPLAKIFVRSYDREHTLELLKRNVDFEIRETFESALNFGRVILQDMGNDPEFALEVEETVRKRDQERLEQQKHKGLHARIDVDAPLKVKPEPLLRPSSESTPLTERTAQITAVKPHEKIPKSSHVE